MTTADPASRTSEEDLVFGFSVNVPGIEKSWSFGFEDVEEITFSIDFLSWGIGLRLPVAGRLESPEHLAEGSTYSATSRMQGLDYSGAQYAAAGLPSESGDEAYFRMRVQGCVELSGVIDVGKECIGPDIRRARDFTTPFGPGSRVSLPTFDQSIVDYGLAGIDLDLDSSVGSDMITADWSVVGAALGSGRLTYSNPSSNEMLSSVRAVDGPGQALFSVEGLLYHFTHFTVTPSVRLWVDVEIPLLLTDLVWEDSWSFGLGTYDLSDIVDRDFFGSDGASVGVHHPGTGYNGATKLTMSVPVANVAPTASLTLAAGQLVDFNGISTVVGNVGEPLQFTGRSHDPGRDGLTVSWIGVTGRRRRTRRPRIR